jgi:erythromycin esterase
LNDYVLTGQGDPAQLLRGMFFWTWDTEEVLAMIRWMREFNASGRGRIQFTGFDMQFPAGAAENVRSFVTQREADYAATVREAAAAASAVTAAGGRGVATPASTPNVKTTLLRWKDIVAHLEAGRTTYRAKGAQDRDIDFAIRNARVVLQALQRRANEVSRDQSMADNVAWIAEQNPNAKIVLWAHNAHVAKGGFAFETMGAALRKMFGARMVVLGFAFNQGSFQARTQGGGALKNFTVPAAPRGSLDATLAAAGVPLFALDLRQAPAWFRKPRGSRQIGAVYPEGAPYAFLMNLQATAAYDAVLFVDKTTAARKNPGR